MTTTPSLSATRRDRSCQKKWGLRLLITAGVASLGFSALLHPRPWLIYNASPSVPIGFYTVSPFDAVETGDLVLAYLPEEMRNLADKRQYLPATVPVLKHVAAQMGDEVCAVATTIRINGKAVAVRQRRDRSHRLMPWWSGCRHLASDEVFLLNARSPYSFDGRYIGVVKVTSIIGKAYPL